MVPKKRRLNLRQKCLRGKFDLKKQLKLNNNQLARLMILEQENTYMLGTMPLEHISDRYRAICPGGSDTDMFIQLSELLDQDNCFNEWVRHALFNHLPRAPVTFFHHNAPFNIQLWQSYKFDECDTYLRKGMCISYSVVRQGKVFDRLGIIGWILSIQDMEFIVIRRLVRLKSKADSLIGDDEVSRVKRLLDGGMIASNQNDLTRLFCQYMKVADGPSTSSWDVIRVDKCSGSNEEAINAIAILQPDCCSTKLVPSVSHSLYSHVFVLQFLIG
jgi:hypothetical protein